MSNIKFIKILALILASSTLVLVGLGGFVRATGAGLACPDWPLCFGRAVPELEYGVAQEVIHRYLGGIVSLGTFLLAYLAFRNRISFPKLWRLAVILLGILAIQVILGGLTVLMKLNPFIVTAHLACGTLFFQLIALTAIERSSANHRSHSSIEPSQLPLQLFRQSPEKLRQAEGRFSSLVLILIVMTYSQIILGGFVGSSGAALACDGFPLCSGTTTANSLNGPQLIQLGHRVLGVSLFLLALFLFIKASKLPAPIQNRKGHLLGILILIGIQIALGVANVWYAVPVPVTIFHLLVAQMILLGFASLYKELTPSTRVFVVPNNKMAESYSELPVIARKTR